MSSKHGKKSSVEKDLTESESSSDEEEIVKMSEEEAASFMSLLNTFLGTSKEIIDHHRRTRVAASDQAYPEERSLSKYTKFVRKIPSGQMHATDFRDLLQKYPKISRCDDSWLRKNPDIVILSQPQSKNSKQSVNIPLGILYKRASDLYTFSIKDKSENAKVLGSYVDRLLLDFYKVIMTLDSEHSTEYKKYIAELDAKIAKRVPKPVISSLISSTSNNGSAAVSGTTTGTDSKTSNGSANGQGAFNGQSTANGHSVSNNQNAAANPFAALFANLGGFINQMAQQVQQTQQNQPGAAPTANGGQAPNIDMNNIGQVLGNIFQGDGLQKIISGVQTAMNGNNLAHPSAVTDITNNTVVPYQQPQQVSSQQPQSTSNATVPQYTYPTPPQVQYQAPTATAAPQPPQYQSPTPSAAAAPQQPQITPQPSQNQPQSSQPQPGS
ncbi:MAG: hypothetical protein Solumvirus3_20 [Solumvirus sp.]|uniref:Uncharacterized protein n=1 Tax=Solumvirus sp. TaxID=2487773 RepID=A0A3G5AI66_9VIRU|nr:MAG: hypothetical protein Solumvirus3_20 [Solumvirus sp.]